MGDPLRLYGLNALVLNGGSGVGEATARTLVRHGASVIAVDKKMSGVEGYFSAVKGITGLAANFADADQISALVQEAVDRLGGIDILINDFPASFEMVMGDTTMNYREFGTTGLKVSELVFGAGAVGGLLINQTDAVKRQAIKIALDAGINWFDTAPSYGQGRSEQALGWLLSELDQKPYISTKFTLDTRHLDDMQGQIKQSLEQSLERLKLDDTVGAWPVHGFVGIWGGLAVAVFGGGDWVAQIVGSIAIPAWAFGTSFVLFGQINQNLSFM